MNKQITDKTPLTVLVKRKKAFTLVELIVVIAIVGILAAVLIPSITGYINNARLSNDKQLVSNLNDRLEIHEIDNKKPQTFHEALTVVAEFGFTTDKIKATSKNNDIVWDMTKNRFSLIDGDSNVIFAESNKTHLWKIYNEIPERSEYSVYLAGTEIKGIVNASFGVDVGKNEDKSLIINYTDNNEEQSVVIRTNGGILRINAPLDSIIHYGTASYVEIINVASSYKESGISYLTKVQKGRYIFNIEHNPDEEKVFVGSNDVIVAVDEKIAKVNIAVDRDSEVSNFTYQIVTKTETNPTEKQDVKIEITKQEIAEYDTVTYSSEDENEISELVDAKLDNVAFSEKKIAKESLGNRIAEKIPNNEINDFTLKIYENGSKREVNPNEYIALDKESLEISLEDIDSTYGFYSEDLFEFTSSNENVATINKKGEITLLSSGSTTIEVKSLTKSLTSEEVKKTFDLHVVVITGFTVTLNNRVLDNNGTITIEVDPENPSDYQFVINYFYNYSDIINDFDIDKGVTFTTQGSIFDIDEDGVILLLPNQYGSQTVSIYLPAYDLHFDFTIEFEELIKNVFESNFKNEDFIYKLGNENEIKLSSLFKIKDGVEVPENYKFGIKFYDYLSASGEGYMSEVDLTSENPNSPYLTYALNQEDQELQLSDKIKFVNTGLVVIRMGCLDQNDKFILGTTVDFRAEVVKGKNVTTSSELTTGTGSKVILNDISITSQFSIVNSYLFGNGFTVDAKAVPEKRESLSSNYVLKVTGSTVENLKMVGAVYPSFSNMTKDLYNSPLVLVNDVSANPDSFIINCDFANCATPLRVNNNTTLTIENTVLRGGSYCNLDLVGGTIVFKGTLITINQSNMNDKTTDGKTVIGAGIVTHFENGAGAGNVSLDFSECSLVQYNTISKSEVNSINSAYTEMGANYIFNNFSNLVYTQGNEKYVNFDIIILSNKVDKKNIKGILTVGTYVEQEWNYSGLGVGGAGYLYVKPCTNVPTYLSEEVRNNLSSSIYQEYYTKPELIINNGINEVNGEDGDSKVLFNKDTYEIEFKLDYFFNVDILSSSKYGYNLVVNLPQIAYFKPVGSSQSEYVEINNNILIISNSGEYELIYSYYDDYTKITYEKSIFINASEIKDQLPPNFQYPSGTDLEIKEGTDGDFYISFGSSNLIPRAGVSIGVQQVEIIISEKNNSITAYKTSHRTGFYGLYPIFDNVITIIDFDENGNSTVYGSNTTTMANGKLTLVGDPMEKFKFASGSTAEASPKNIGGKYYWVSPKIEADRTVAHGSVPNTEYIFIGNNGRKYHYYVSYYLREPHTYSASCFTEGTMITLADGSKKPIELITKDDLLLVWDFFNGEVSFSNIVFIEKQNAFSTIINTKFSNGSELNIANSHSIFSIDDNKYIELNEDNISSYVGSRFVGLNSEGYQIVTLESYSISYDVIDYYSLITANTFNVIAEDMLTVCPPEDLYNLYTIVNMQYDLAQLQNDIETYGLYDYSVFSDYVSYEMFLAYNGPYLKACVEKGIITLEKIFEYIEIYKEFFVV